MTATGLPLPIASASEMVWSGHGGTWVQIGSTPRVSVNVGEGARGAGWPGMTTSDVGATWNATSTRLSSMVSLAYQTPAAASAASITYTPRRSARPSWWRSAVTGVAKRASPGALSATVVAGPAAKSPLFRRTTKPRRCGSVDWYGSIDTTPAVSSSDPVSYTHLTLP